MVVKVSIYLNRRVFVMKIWHERFFVFITKTRLYNFDLLKPHFYTVKLGFTGVYIIFFISAQKHRLWVLVRMSTNNLCFEQQYEKYQSFLSEIVSFGR